MAVTHLLKDGEWFITVCGLDDEFAPGGGYMVAIRDKTAITCKRCIAVMRKVSKKQKYGVSDGR